MTKFSVEIYVASSGVSLAIPLPGENEHRLCTEYLQSVVRGPNHRYDPGLPETFPLENNGQLSAFYDFLRAMKIECPPR